VRVLVVNAGSSSTKLRLLDGADTVEHSADLPAGPDAADLDLLRDWTPPDVVGHRIVHGGTHFTGPVVITGPVRERLAALTDLAPLHQPKSLAMVDAVSARLPDIPAVASFDTAFHTTMGFTPLEGLVMATRSGSVDPGLLLWLEEHEHLTPHEIATALEHRSGLTALAGTGDMREITDRGDPDATLAIDVYTHRLAAGIAAMTAATGGLDALVFTGGVGEHSPIVRRRATERLAHLGVAIDPHRNDTADHDEDISTTGAAVRTMVITAREDLQIAGEARDLLS
jgi:acetate kinase